MMEVEILHEGTSNQTVIITGIEGDMAEAPRLNFLQQPDGDVILSLSNGSGVLPWSIEFCTSTGGGRRPVIAKKLRELIAELQKEENR